MTAQTWQAVSVVVPVRDESDNVAPLSAEILAALSGRIEFELLYVDDGSRDSTPSLLADLGRQHRNLRLVRHERSCGQSAAIRTGVERARYPWIVTLDGDGQNDPADIPQLLDAFAAQGGTGLVTGWRRRRRDTWIKRLSSRVANGVRSGLLGDATPDTGCGLKVFGRELFLALPFFDHMHRFLPALVLRQGGTVRSVEVNHRPRERGKSKYGLHNRLWVGIVDLFGVWWLMRRMKRPVIVKESQA